MGVAFHALVRQPNSLVCDWRFRLHRPLIAL
jgi:hypothetical protein